MKKLTKTMVVRGMFKMGYDVEFICSLLEIPRDRVINIKNKWRSENKEHVLRWDREARRRGRRGDYRSGKAYTEDEHREILARDTPVRELAWKLQRSEKAIRARRDVLRAGEVGIR